MEEDHSGVKLLVLISLSFLKIIFSLVYTINRIFLRFSVQHIGEPTKFTYVPLPTCDERPFSLLPQFQHRQLPLDTLC